MRPPVAHHTPQRRRFAPRLLFLALIAGGAFALTGCSTPVAPEVTFFADGHAVNSPPLIHCDALVRNCQQSTEGAAKLKVRPGKPVHPDADAAVLRGVEGDLVKSGHVEP